MPADSALLQSVTRAIYRASGPDDVRDRVCAAVVDAGLRYACFLRPDRPPVTANLPTSDARAFAATTPGAVTVEADSDRGTHVYVPVAYGGVDYGTLVLGVEDAPDADERERLAGVGDAIGHGVASMLEVEERERAEAELRDERRQIEKLHSVAAQMVRCDDETGIYELAIDAAENILEFDICSVDVAEGGFLVPKATSTGMSSGDSERVSADHGVAGDTYQNTETIVVDDVAEYAGVEPSNPDYRSVLSVPIEGLGVFQAASVEKREFTEEDAELAELLMAHVGETLKRLRADAALRESEQKYRTLVEQSHDAVAIFQDGGFEFVNQRACALFGRGRGALRTINAWAVVHAEDRPRLRRIHGELTAETGRQDTFEARVLRPDGGVRHCEFSATSIDYHGDAAVLSSIRDITERKERERELERQNERLEEFASVVSHDLRSPINVARGSVDLARSTGDDDHLDRAEGALDRMETLVEDILDFARQGKLVNETEPVPLDDVVEEAWASIDAPDAALDASLADDLVAADRVRLLELFENLFRNAVEHGGSDVTVTVTATADGFRVADDGAGIPDGARDELFDRGFTSTDDGTGFGLAIVENIADAHGWRIEAVPDVGGACFEVSGCQRPE